MFVKWFFEKLNFFGKTPNETNYKGIFWRKLSWSIQELRYPQIESVALQVTCRWRLQHLTEPILSKKSASFPFEGSRADICCIFYTTKFGSSWIDILKKSKNQNFMGNRFLSNLKNSVNISKFNFEIPPLCKTFGQRKKCCTREAKLKHFLGLVLIFCRHSARYTAIWIDFVFLENTCAASGSYFRWSRAPNGCTDEQSIPSHSSSLAIVLWWQIYGLLHLAPNKNFGKRF